MTALQLFTRALESATGHSYVSALTFTPLRVPAYKEFNFVLKQLDGEVAERKIYKLSYRERVTSEEEKEMVTEALTEKFIAYILQEMLKNR
jgi:hypothetical protein